MDALPRIALLQLAAIVLYVIPRTAVLGANAELAGAGLELAAAGLAAAALADAGTVLVGSSWMVTVMLPGR